MMADLALRRVVAMMVFVALSLPTFFCQAREPLGNEPLHLVQTIALPDVHGRIDHLAVDLQNRRLFIAALGNDTVEIIDLRAGRRVHTIRGLSEPQGVLFVHAVNRLFVANGTGGRVDVFDGESFAIVRSIGGLPDADNLRYDATHERVYVGYGAGAIRILDAGTAESLGDIRLSGHPEAFQLESAGLHRLFVNVPTMRQIAVASTATRRVTVTWPVARARSNFPMALDESDHRLFVATRNPAQLLVYDTETGRAITTVGIVGDADDVFFDAARKSIYVSGGAGFVSVLQQRDADHYSVVASVPTRPGARTSLFVPEWDRLYLAVPQRGHAAAEVRVYAVGQNGF